MQIMNYRISLPYVTFRIEVQDGIVTDTTPVAKWMIGKSIIDVLNFVRESKGEIKVIT